MHQIVRALAERDWDEAERCVRQPAEGGSAWSAERFEREMEAYFADYQDLAFTALSRQAHLTGIEKRGPREWRVTQVLVDPEQDNVWCLEGRIDLRHGRSTESPLVILDRIGP